MLVWQIFPHMKTWEEQSDVLPLIQERCCFTCIIFLRLFLHPMLQAPPRCPIEDWGYSQIVLSDSPGCKVSGGQGSDHIQQGLKLFKAFQPGVFDSGLRKTGLECLCLPGKVKKQGLKARPSLLLSRIHIGDFPVSYAEILVQNYSISWGIVGNNRPAITIDGESSEKNQMVKMSSVS